VRPFRTLSRPTLANWLPSPYDIENASQLRSSIISNTPSLGGHLPEWANMVPTVIPLSLLAAGQIAEIFQVAGLPAHTRRLGEMGLREGARVQMLRQGSPCIVRLENSRLCFRESEMSSILVRTSTAAAECAS
jgi:ferrous iron transport protein A